MLVVDDVESEISHFYVTLSLSKTKQDMATIYIHAY